MFACDCVPVTGPSRWRLLPALVAALAIVLQLGTGSVRAITIKHVSAIRSAARFDYPPLVPAPFPEVPPWFVRDGGYRYFISTDHSYQCVTSGSLLDKRITCTRSYTALATEAEADIFHDPARIPSGTAFKRNYEGVYTAQLLKGANGRSYIVGIDHAENKNEVRAELIGGRVTLVRYHNTVQPHDTTCFSMVIGVVYEDCNPDYNGFIDSSYAPDTASSSFGLHGWRDRGPIVWPREGYIQAKAMKASWGVRHPSSIIAAGYLYVYYLDTGSARSDPTGLSTQGAGAGIVVARSSTTDLARPGTFRVWGGRRGWVSALPRGLARSDESRYFDRPGGDAVPLLGRNRGSYYFAVARVEHPGRWRYFAIEHYSVAHSPICLGRGTTLSDTLWESRDLIHWRHPTPIPQLTSCGSDQSAAYDNSQLRFPHFLNDTATSDSEINPASFYLIGSSATRLTLVHLSVMP